MKSGPAFGGLSSCLTSRGRQNGRSTAVYSTCGGDSDRINGNFCSPKGVAPECKAIRSRPSR
ncbi:hypothetical protein M8494_04750 [Serratia ureilytica]